MMDAHGAGPRDEAKMSDAAIQALDELLGERREKVLEVARRSSPREVLTAADVIRAYYSSEERRNSPGPNPFSLSRGRALSVVWGIAGGLAGLLSAVVATIALSREGSSGAQAVSDVAPVVFVFGAVAVALVLSMLIIGVIALRASLWASRADRTEHKVGSIEFSGSGTLNSADDVDRGLFVLREWAKVEDRLRGLVTSRDEDSPTGRRPIGDVIAVLKRLGALNDAWSADLQKVVAVRNKVAHGEPVPQEQIEEAAVLVRQLDDRLEKLQHGFKELWP